MAEKFSERRQAENEVFFRELNEKVEKTFKELEQIAKEEGQATWIREANLPVHFFCECADEECRERIILKPSIYKKFHKDRSTFIVKKGHEVDAIEEVVKSTPGYYVVKKHAVPPEKARTLNPTDLNKS